MSANICQPNTFMSASRNWESSLSLSGTHSTAATAVRYQDRGPAWLAQQTQWVSVGADSLRNCGSIMCQRTAWTLRSTTQHSMLSSIRRLTRTPFTRKTRNTSSRLSALRYEIRFDGGNSTRFPGSTLRTGSPRATFGQPAILFSSHGSRYGLDGIGGSDIGRVLRSGPKLYYVRDGKARNQRL